MASISVSLMSLMDCESVLGDISDERCSERHSPVAVRGIFQTQSDLAEALPCKQTLLDPCHRCGAMDFLLRCSSIDIQQALCFHRSRINVPLAGTFFFFTYFICISQKFFRTCNKARRLTLCQHPPHRKHQHIASC